MDNLDSFKLHTSPNINIKNKYIKSLRMNHLYYKARTPKKPESRKIIEKYVYKKFHKIYKNTNDFYNIKIINEIITNQSSHIVAEFKDYLIKDDFSEFIWKFYKLKESRNLLGKIFSYYKQTSVVFPNYILLTANKYLYKNIQRKQKLINILEEKDEEYILSCKKVAYDTDDFFDISSKVFNSNILDSILNESNTSQIKKSLFGVSTENSNMTDNEGDNKLNNLVNNISKIEENCYISFLEKKKLKINKNIIKNKNDNLIKEEGMSKENSKNELKSQKLTGKINNKNIIISRNRHKTAEISKYTKFSKNRCKNKNKNRTNTASFSNDFRKIKILRNIVNKKENYTFINNNANNMKIIFNNIYKTDLYLNINNNIIIKEVKNKSIDNQSKTNKKKIQKIVNKIDLNKIKNLGITKDSLSSDKRKNKYLRKNDINNLLFSIKSHHKEIYNRLQNSERKKDYYKNKTERERENKSYFEIKFGKKLIKNRKNKTDIIITNFNKNKIKADTSRTFENNKNSKKTALDLNIVNNNKIMVNKFKNTLNNLMGIINKKHFERNNNINRKNFKKYKEGYSSRYSSLNNKKKFIESYNDSIINAKNKFQKSNNSNYKHSKDITVTNKNNFTSRSCISVRNKLGQNTRNNSKKRHMKIGLNSVKPGKIKKIIDEFNSIEEKQIKNENEKINLKKCNYIKKNDILSLTSRESYEYNRNKYNKNNKINYTSFISNPNNRIKIFQNQLITYNFNNILIGRAKSYRNSKNYKKSISTSNNKENIISSKKINHNKELENNYFEKTIKERISKLNKSVKCKRNNINNNYLKSKNNSRIDSSLYANNNLNVNINKNNVKEKKYQIVKKPKIKEYFKDIKKDYTKINQNKNIKNKTKKFNRASSEKSNFTKINYSQIEMRNKKYRNLNNNMKNYKMTNYINNNKTKSIISSYTDRLYQKNYLYPFSNYK